MALLATALIVSFASVGAAQAVDTYIGVLFADDGTFSGTSEGKYISEQLANQSAVSLPDCQSAVTGFLSGADGKQLPAILVATGIGGLAAAMCTRTVLEYAPLTTLLWVGTSGISPFQHGGLNPSIPGGCDRVQLGADAKVHPIGSVCITSVATSLACALCVHSDSPESLNECSLDDCTDYGNEALFGKCTGYSSAEFSSSVFHASRNISFPAPSLTLLNYSQKYWETFGYTVSTEQLLPLVSRNCVEGDLQIILASGPKDYSCRKNGAAALNINRGDAPSVSAENVTCFAAMEGLGLLRTTARYPTLPVVIIRGGSNYDMYPLVEQSKGVWSQDVHFVSPETRDGATKAGYAYAIQTTNAVALNYIATMI